MNITHVLLSGGSIQYNAIYYLRYLRQQDPGSSSGRVQCFLIGRSHCSVADMDFAGSRHPASAGSAAADECRPIIKQTLNNILIC